MPAIAVFVRFIAGGFKWPLRAGDQLEIWSDRHELCGTVDAAMLLDLLAVFLRSADLTKRLADAVTTAPVVERTAFRLPEAPPERKPLGPPLPGRITSEQKAQKRQGRKSRKRGASMLAGLTTALSHLGPLLA